jgi:hypothetical protein
MRGPALYQEETTMKLKLIRSDRGATDPILVIAAIAVSLVLLIGGSFAVSGIVTSGHNLNAKTDLDRASVAESAYYAERDVFVAYRQSGTTAERVLENSDVGFSPTQGGQVSVILSPAADSAGNPVIAGQTEFGWAAISKSSSSKSTRYIRTSASQAITEVDASGPTWKLKGATAVKTTAELKALGITVANLKAALK